MLRPTWIDDGSPIDDPFGYGERAVEWLKRRRHHKSPTGFYEVHPFVERIVRRIYGPRHEDGTRIVKEVFLGLPRGNRKTSLSAALMLLHLCGPEAIVGGKLVTGASTRKQAREAYEEAAAIIACERGWRGKLRLADHRNSIRFPALRTAYEAISSDAGGAHGMTPSFALIDELHAHHTSALFEAVRTGCDKTTNSLLIVATTAGAGSENICHERWHYACRVQRGEVVDPEFLPIVFAAEQSDDWQDESLWYAVNPGLEYGFPPIAAMRRHAKEAENVPGSKRSFTQLRLNLWSDTAEDPFVEMGTYDRGAEPAIDLDALADRPCWLGVDLSSRLDLTAVVACWRTDDGAYVVHPWFFCPEANIAGREIKNHEVPQPYQKWADQRLIIPTPGNVVDYDAVEQHIVELCDRFNVQSIGFDPWRASFVISRLIAKSLPAVEFPQSASRMVPAIAELQRAILAGRFRHGGHPVLRWNFENIRCAKDAADNLLFRKGKSVDKIDGAVAAAMAVQLAFDSENPGPGYNDPNLDFSKFVGL